MRIPAVCLLPLSRAMNVPAPEPEPDRFALVLEEADCLSDREQLVLDWLAEGETQAEIAARLKVSAALVWTLKQKVIYKLRGRIERRIAREGFVGFRVVRHSPPSPPRPTFPSHERRIIDGQEYIILKLGDHRWPVDEFQPRTGKYCHAWVPIVQRDGDYGVCDLDANEYRRPVSALS